MIQETFATYEIRSKRHSSMIAMFAAFSIVCLVFMAVNMYIGENKLPKGFKGTNLYFFLGMIAFAALAAYIHFKKVFNLLIYKSGRQVCVEIEDPQSIEPVKVVSPFRMERQWVKVDLGRGAKMKQLNLTFVNAQEEAVFTIVGNLGSLQDAPADWEYVNLFNDAERSTYYMSKQQYSSSKYEDIFIDVEMALRNVQPA